MRSERTRNTLGYVGVCDQAAFRVQVTCGEGSLTIAVRASPSPAVALALSSWRYPTPSLYTLKPKP